MSQSISHGARRLVLSTFFMEPEIDRRCPDCGAAVRAQSAFCPQCGRAMKAGAGVESAPVESTPAVRSENVEPPKTNLADKGVDNSTRPLAVTAPSGRVSELSSTVAPSNPEQVSPPAQVAREHIASGKTGAPLPESRARGKGQRVVGAARDVVEERIGPRVEKLRQASTVVWSEAQDDPNLRFILVAVFLFILAIVIILLGTYIR